MALVLADRVRDTTTTTGTGTITLSGTAPTGYQNFSVVGNGNTTYYTINADSQWEVGIGTYSSTGPTLSRGTVLASSNGGALVDFAAGIKDVFITYPAEKAVTDAYGTALAATTATNIAGGAAGSIPYQTAANTTSLLAAGTGVLVGGSTPSYTMSPSLTQVTVAADPTAAFQVATKQYVDTIAASGVTYHTPVKYEVPSPLTATYNNGSSGVGATLTNAGTLAAFAPDGPVASVGDRILVYTQTNAAQNGVYTVTTVGSGSVAWVLTRATDADTYALKSPNGLGEGDAFFVTSGNTGAGETYVMNTVGTITFGTTAINFVQVSDAAVYSAGTGLTLTGTVFSLTSPVATTLGGTGLTSFTSGGAVYATSSSALTTGTLPATAGGTGQSSYTTGDLLYATSGTALGGLADVATGNALLSGGVGAAPAWGKVGLTTHVTGTLPVANGGSGATSLTGYLVGNGTSAFTATTTIPTSALSGTISLTTQVSGTLGAGNGGTGISSYTVGDILYASATTTLSTLADVATGNALISGGVSNPPSWGKIGLTTHVSGTLPVSNGGSGATTLTGYLKGNGTSAFTASATIPAGDITGAALTKADDTNVTLTLGGSPSTALLAATSITAGWTGQLAVSRGGTGNSTLTSNYLLKGNGVSPVAASIVYDNGTNVGVGTSSPTTKIKAYGNTANTPTIINVQHDASGNNFDYASVSATSSSGSVGITSWGTGSVRAGTGWVQTVGAIPLVVGVNDSEVSRFDTSGNLLNYTSVRAPIFYDYDNTAYYVNPAGASALNSVTFGLYPTSAGGGGQIVPATGSPYSLRQDFGSDNTGWRYGVAKNVSGTATVLFYVQDNGSVVATGDMSAPIFYDSNNTGYYLDPAGSSVLGTITAQSTNDAQLYLNSNGTTWAGISWSDVGGTDYMFYYGGTSTFAIGGGGSAVASKKLHVNGGTTIGSGLAGTSVSANGLLVETRVDAPVFYDSNNTAYYVDPAGTSNINSVIVAGTISIAGTYGRSAAGTGYLNGNYNSVETNSTTGPIYCISAGYAPTGTSLSNMYGVGFTDGATAGVYSGAGWGLYVAAAGVARVFLDGNSGITFSNGSVRSPIFYDLNDTGYYCDPNSNSILYGVTIYGAASASATGNQLFLWTGGGTTSAIGFKNGGYFTNPTGNGDGYNTYLTMDTDGRGWVFRRGVGGGDFTAAYTSGWILNNGLWQANASMRAPVFYDSNDTSYYVDAASSSILNTLYFRNSSGANVLVGNASTFGYSSGYRTLLLGNQAYTTVCIGVDPVANPSGSFNGAGSGVEVMFKNGVNFITPNSANNSYLTPLSMLDGYAYNYTSMRSPIFYDSDNTAYYCNPTGNSVFNTVEASNVVQYPGWPGYPGIDANAYTYNAISSFTYSNNAPWTGPIVAFPAGGYGLQLNAPYGGSGSALSFRTRNGDTATFNSWYRLAVYDANPSSGSMYAAIYYDAQNTSYYLNPESTSILWETRSYYLTNIAYVNDNHTFGVYFSGDRNADYAIYRESGAWTSPYPDLRFAFYTGMKFTAESSYGGMRFFNDTSFATQVMSVSNSSDGLGAGNVYVNNSLQAGSSLRAPIFYDSNDTSYYCNPNGLSVLYKFENINQRCAYDRAWDNYPSITVYNTTDQGPQGDFRIHGAPGANGGDFSVRLLVDGDITSLQSLNAGSAAYVPIYYDSNNTGYYCDPTGYSQFSSVYTNNWFRSQGQSGWYSESYGGGWYMQDTTWVRTYNSKNIFTAADIAAGGNITAYYSDERLKTKTGGIDNALDKVSSLEGFLYVENDLARSLGYTNEKQQVGVSAQQVQAVLPEAVSLAPVDFETLEDGTIVSKSGEDYLTVDYSRLVPLLIEAIKELKSEVNDLKAALH